MPSPARKWRLMDIPRCWRWYSQFATRRMNVKLLMGIKIIGSLTLLYLINLIVTPRIVGIHTLEGIFRPRYRMVFNSSLWKTSLPKDGTRLHMVDSLLSSELIHGLHEVRLIELLGQPTITQAMSASTNYYYTLAYQETHPARSWLFPGMFWNFDNWSLKVVLTNQIVKECDIVF